MAAYSSLEDGEGTGRELVLLEQGDFVLAVKEAIVSTANMTKTGRDKGGGSYVSSLRGLVRSSLSQIKVVSSIYPFQGGSMYYA